MINLTKRNGLFCPICDKPQFNTGCDVVCINGHEGIEGYKMSDSLDYIYDWLENIKNTPGINDKIAMLIIYLSDSAFLQVIQLMYDAHLHYGVKEIPLCKKNTFNRRKLFTFLKTLSTQKGASDVDKRKLAKLCSISAKTRKLVHKIINKDAKSGFGAKLINKAKPGTVFIEPYMRCSTEKKIDRIVYPAIVQQKADGLFVNIKIYKNDTIEFITRNGKKVHQLGKLKSILRKKIPREFHGIVFHGELLIQQNGKILNRQTGNGVFNSCLSNTADQKLADKAIIKIWDVVTLKAYNAHKFDLDYIKRYKRCKKLVKLVNHAAFMCVRTKKVNTYAEARSFYKYIRSIGGEGVILKNFSLKWKNHTATDCVKLKNVIDFDLKLIGWKKGKKGTRFENYMGALICESECGKLHVSIGTGFSDTEREKNWDNEIGKIITVSCESIIKDKSKQQHSLFLPRYIELRPDRNVAQTLKDMQKR